MTINILILHLLSVILTLTSASVKFKNMYSCLILYFKNIHFFGQYLWEENTVTWHW